MTELFQQGSLLQPETLEDWTPEVVSKVIAETLETWGFADYGAKVRWCWNPRLRTTIGRAIFEDHLLELNPHLLARHPAEIRGVLIHELAHLVVVAHFGFRESPHGPRWKGLMRAAGESTRATHQLDVGNLRRRRKNAQPRPRRSRQAQTLSRLEAWWRRLSQRGW